MAGWISYDSVYETIEDYKGIHRGTYTDIPFEDNSKAIDEFMSG